LFFFVFITCESCFNSGIAQDSGLYPMPWIQELKLPDYYTHIPNNSFFMDRSGTLFLGKENGLTIVSELRPVHIHMKGPVRVTGNGKDTVFFASENDLGLILRDRNGQYVLITYKDRISRAFREFIPSQLILAGSSLFMNCEKGIYRLTEGRIEVYPYPDMDTKMFMLEDCVFLRVKGKGWFMWSGDGFVQPDNMPRDIELLGSVIPDTTASGPELLEFLRNDEFLVVSPEKGIRVLDSLGKVTVALGTSQGLPDRDIAQTCACEGGELWILGPYSLHRVDYPVALSILSLDEQIIGRIFASKARGKGMILATGQGVFEVSKTEEPAGSWGIFNITGNISGSFNLLDQSGKYIFSAGSGHLVAITDRKAEVMASGSFTGLAAISDTMLIASGKEGLTIFRFDSTKWNNLVLDPSLSSAHSFARFGNELFFLCGNHAYRISFEPWNMVLLPFHRDELLLRLLPADNKLYLITDQQVFQYSDEEESFLPLEKDHEARMLTVSDIMIPDGREGYWEVRHHGKYMSRVLHTRSSAADKEEPEVCPVLQNLGEVIDLNLSDSILYLTGNDKITIFDLTIMDRDNPGLRVLVEVTGGSRKSRSAGFHLAGMEFQSNPEPEFRYRLIPEQTVWTEWSTEREVLFEHIRPGSYTLQAQARDLYGRISEISESGLSIRPAVYRTWYAYTLYTLVFLIALFLIQKLRLLSYQRAESRVSERMQSKLEKLAFEKEKSDRLVAEILPERTAEQLKSEGKAKWDKYERATVLFSDIQGFTRIAEEMNPEALIDELDKFFFHFDSVVEKYNIEKIKTIGDAYMAAGGIPEKNSTNPVEVVLAALEMQTYMQQLKSRKANIWDLRIGIHTGPVIAGVVGHKKVSYDIWGDTVNTASRMESSGEAGKVNISGITYGMVKEYFICEYRGKLPVKYKGNIDMYFVNGLRPELSIDLKGLPNKRFFTKLQLLRLGDLEEKIFGTILSELPSALHFHKIEYARKVYNQSFLICRAEEIEQDERLLVRTAALMLYTGLTQAYFNYENRSSVIAREILPAFKYSETQIDQICNLIMATKQPFHPTNQLEKILIDAKMEYIGRPDYTTLIKLQYQELREAGSPINGQQFKKQQLELLYGFSFFTLAAQRLREVPGEDQMAALENERWI
jgi:adenylate cyclase